MASASASANASASAAHEPLSSNASASAAHKPFKFSVAWIPCSRWMPRVIQDPPGELHDAVSLYVPALARSPSNWPRRLGHCAICNVHVHASHLKLCYLCERPVCFRCRARVGTPQGDYYVCYVCCPPPPPPPVPDLDHVADPGSGVETPTFDAHIAHATSDTTAVASAFAS